MALFGRDFEVDFSFRMDFGERRSSLPAEPIEKWPLTCRLLSGDVWVAVCVSFGDWPSLCMNFEGFILHRIGCKRNIIFYLLLKFKC